MRSRPSAFLLRARLVRGPHGWYDRGAVVVERGRVAWLGPADRVASTGLQVKDLGDCALVRGFVNAHAHLDLTGVQTSEREFAPWVRAMVAARRSRGPAEVAQAWRAGERSLLAGGCTTSADIDGGDQADVAWTAQPTQLRVLSFVELLDGRDPRRLAGQLARLRASCAVRQHGRWRRALSPHAPHTVSAPLLSAAARAGTRLQVHCAETEAEVQWLLEGTGPLRDLLPASPRQGPLEVLHRAGVLQRGTTLVHANALDPARDGARLARLGVSVVHCPGTHAWFGRAPFPLAAWRAQGVRVVLGTDSAASNERLDCRHEAALALDRLRVAPSEVLDMLGDAAEEALGRPFGCTGLRVGARADFAAHATTLQGEAALEEVLRGARPVMGSWIAGRETLPFGPD